MERYLKLFTNHTAYEAAKNSIDKPNVVKCQLENEVHYTTAVIINFTIDYNPYQAEDGMTWGEWVNSSYNTGGFRVGTYGSMNNAIINSFGSAVSNNNRVTENDYIIANVNYDVDLPID